MQSADVAHRPPVFAIAPAHVARAFTVEVWFQTLANPAPVCLYFLVTGRHRRPDVRTKPRDVAMPPDLSFHECMARLRAGDEESARQVFERFAHRLVGLAAHRLPEALRPKVDPEDVVQSVFRSFFARHAAGQFHLEAWDGLWGLLAVLTARKCSGRLDHFLAACRDVRRETKPTPAAAGDSVSTWQPAAAAPSPAEAAILDETLGQALAAVKEAQRPIVLLRLQGFRESEIAAQVGCTERTVERVLKKVREHLLLRVDADHPAS
jgi:RNA polymerase sigma-70 factor (ECF subfamily)